MTINEALTLIKAIRKRISSLEALRESVSNKTTYYSAQEKTVDPQYDVKVVDKKIMELEKIMFSLDTAIKKQNAIAEIDFTFEMETIFESLT